MRTHIRGISVNGALPGSGFMLRYSTRGQHHADTLRRLIKRYKLEGMDDVGISQKIEPILIQLKM